MKKNISDCVYAYSRTWQYVCAGQRKKSRAEMKKEFKEFKVKSIAQEVDLQDDQQKQFFELYEQMSDEKDASF